MASHNASTCSWLEPKSGKTTAAQAGAAPAATNQLTSLAWIAVDTWAIAERKARCEALIFWASKPDKLLGSVERKARRLARLSKKYSALATA